MEWLLWAGLLLLVIAWPLLFVAIGAIRRSGMGAPKGEYRSKEHAELQAWSDSRDVRGGGRGW
ncbi:MAG TPA: hypothetical protein VGA16_03660 [Candidatus Limnocylindria bacterium]